MIPLHTQKYVWRLRHDPTYASNCRTLKESRKVCCRVLSYHRLITSEHSTHTPRFSTLTPRFFVSEFWVFIDWSHPNIPHTHTTMLDAPPRFFVSEIRVCFRVLGFHRLITSQHSTQTPRCSTLISRFFVFEFPGDHFFRGPFFRDF